MTMVVLSSCLILWCWQQKKEREAMLLRIAMMRSELQRQRKALSREMDLRQKERTQLQRKGKSRSCPALSCSKGSGLSAWGGLCYPC